MPHYKVSVFAALTAMVFFVGVFCSGREGGDGMHLDLQQIALPEKDEFPKEIRLQDSNSDGVGNGVQSVARHDPYDIPKEIQNQSTHVGNGMYLANTEVTYFIFLGSGREGGDGCVPPQGQESNGVTLDDAGLPSPFAGNEGATGFHLAFASGSGNGVINDGHMDSGGFLPPGSGTEIGG